MKKIKIVFSILAVALVVFEGYIYYEKSKGLSNTLNPFIYLTYLKYEYEIISFLKNGEAVNSYGVRDPLFNITVTRYTKRNDGSVYVRALMGSYNPKLSIEENIGCCGLTEFIKKDGVWSKE